MTEVVDDIERPKAATVAKRIRHAIHRPPLERRRRAQHRDALGTRQSLSRSASYLKASFAIHTVDALVIRLYSLTGYEHVQPPVAIPWADRRMRLEAS